MRKMMLRTLQEVRRQNVAGRERKGRGLSRSLGTLALVVLLALVSTSARAVLMTYDVSFTANSFVVGSGGDAAPVDPVLGSFKVTLDPAVAVTNSTANISLTSLNIALGSPLSFTYKPGVDGSFPAGTLRVGGSASGSDIITFNPSTNDFWLFINDLSGTPAFQQVGYTQTSVSSNNLFFTLNQTGSVSVTASAVPESSALPFVAMTMLAGIGSVSLRIARKRTGLSPS